MFSPDEQRKIQAMSLQQWQRAQREAQDTPEAREAYVWRLLLTAEDEAFLRALPYPISPA